jgi:hypothetical protein
LEIFCTFAAKLKETMQKIRYFVSHYPLSLICILLIWVLSLTPFFPETPFDDVAFIDKWTHLVMYGGTCSVIWWEHLRCCKKEARRLNRQALVVNWKALCSAMLAMVALGGLMELLQAYCTTTRSGEWLDFWSDSVGVLLGTLIGLILYCYFKKASIARR